MNTTFYDKYIHKHVCYRDTYFEYKTNCSIDKKQNIYLFFLYDDFDTKILTQSCQILLIAHRFLYT